MEKIIRLGKQIDLMKAFDKLDKKSTKKSTKELYRIKFLVSLKWCAIEGICKCLEIVILFITVFLATYLILTLIGL